MFESQFAGGNTARESSLPELGSPKRTLKKSDMPKVTDKEESENKSTSKQINVYYSNELRTSILQISPT